jgi:RNA polymerase sigma-70 factor (ECF subfamily)
MSVTAEPASATADVSFEQGLASRMGRARTAWPQIRFEPVALRAHLDRHLGAGLSPAALEAIEVEDLCLAWACAQRDVAAVAVLEGLLVLPGQVQRMNPSPGFLDDVRQEVRQKLLGDGAAAPRILEYSGRGPLGRWIRVVALRAALSIMRGEAARPTSASSSWAADDLISSPDPELDFAKLRDRGQLHQAVSDAFAALAPRDRNLLRLHHLDRVSLDQLARLHRVHRATVARWLADARQTIVDQTRSRLREALGLSPSECDSLVRFLQSRLELDFAAALAVPAPPP